MAMRNDIIRFRKIYFDWQLEIVFVDFIVGTQAMGGYEDRAKFSFEWFEKLPSLEELKETIKLKIKPLTNTP